MKDTDYTIKILGIVTPWKVTEVELDVEGEEVRVHVALDSKETLLHFVSWYLLGVRGLRHQEGGVGGTSWTACEFEPG